MALADHPRTTLLFGPSPIHPLDRLSDHLGGARLWAKREDCNSGLAFGGNKVRKLEYLAADALAALRAGTPSAAQLVAAVAAGDPLPPTPGGGRRAAPPPAPLRPPPTVDL